MIVGVEGGRLPQWKAGRSCGHIGRTENEQGGPFMMQPVFLDGLWIAAQPVVTLSTGAVMRQRVSGAVEYFWESASG